ncbi:MAG TPA: hypothetical protein VNQ79_18310 [Blastocatellia bacterium]|nr:hypothetical protein [Blastocatellia bacterium]
MSVNHLTQISSPGFCLRLTVSTAAAKTAISVPMAKKRELLPDGNSSHLCPIEPDPCLAESSLIQIRCRLLTPEPSGSVSVSLNCSHLHKQKTETKAVRLKKKNFRKLTGRIQAPEQSLY